jgi:hypothetical protein
VKENDSLKEAAAQRGREPGNRGITIVRSHYQAATAEDTRSWKRLSMIL